MLVMYMYMCSAFEKKTSIPMLGYVSACTPLFVHARFPHKKPALEALDDFTKHANMLKV